MMKPVYILSGSVISPQFNYEDTGLPVEIKTGENGILFITDPDYRKYINPVAIRRMSRALKMGISTGMNALEQAGITKPDSIITGTGRGSMTDMEHFLVDMIQHNEEALTPTSFIQSTYNSINGWLALQTKCTGYNQTYVHRGNSFELTLLDAQMLLNETDTEMNILAGCFDEITTDYVKVKGKIGYWKEPLPPNTELYQHSNTNGTIAGEGSAFFTISNGPDNALCSIVTVEMLQNATGDEIKHSLNSFLAFNGLQPEDIDVTLCGENGDCRHQYIYDNVSDVLSSRTVMARFKHLCGEYDTSSGFATWLALHMFRTQKTPGILLPKGENNSGIQHILIVNHYILNSTSFILLKANI